MHCTINEQHAPVRALILDNVIISARDIWVSEIDRHCELAHRMGGRENKATHLLASSGTLMKGDDMTRERAAEPPQLQISTRGIREGATIRQTASRRPWKQRRYTTIS